MIEIQSPTLLQEVYMLYQVEPNKIPQEIPSTGECIGYDVTWPEFTELKQFRILKLFCELGLRYDIDKHKEYSIMLQDNGDKNRSFIFTEEDKEFDKCLIKVLITLYDELMEHEQTQIRNLLNEEL